MGRPQHLHGKPPPRAVCRPEGGLDPADMQRPPAPAIPLVNVSRTPSRAYDRLRRSTSTAYDGAREKSCISNQPAGPSTTEPNIQPEPEMGESCSDSSGSPKPSRRIITIPPTAVESEDLQVQRSTPPHPPGSATAESKEPDSRLAPETIQWQPQCLDDTASIRPSLTIGSDQPDVVGRHSETVLTQDTNVDCCEVCCCVSLCSCYTCRVLLRCVRRCLRCCVAVSCGHPWVLLAAAVAVGAAVVKFKPTLRMIQWYRVSSSIASWFRIPLVLVPLFFLVLLMGAERLLPRKALPWAHTLVEFVFRLRFVCRQNGTAALWLRNTRLDTLYGCAYSNRTR